MSNIMSALTFACAEDLYNVVFQTSAQADKGQNDTMKLLIASDSLSLTSG